MVAGLTRKSNKQKDLQEVLFSAALLQLDLKDVSKVLAAYNEFKSDPSKYLQQLGLDIKDFET